VRGAQYEFQRLHGMGDALYGVVKTARPVRIYAPVGAHEDLLPYLVRRLLEMEQIHHLFTSFWMRMCRQKK